ncbi:MAG: NYN domain-containing protein [Clostridia bacterium]|nr:NYN domain-containing protein [Clostridia bacterium]
MTKVIILIDGDNLSGNCTNQIIQKAKKYGEIYETHCFANFLKRPNWVSGYYENGMKLHFVPEIEKKKNGADPNTSDIELSVFAMKKLYECPEIDAFIIVADDKDYIPLAKAIREDFHKKAYLFYTQQGNRAPIAYDEAVVLTNEIVQEVEKPNEEVIVDRVKNDFLNATLAILKNRFENGEKEVSLSVLGMDLKKVNQKPNKKFLNKLQELFNEYPVLNESYRLIGGGEARIVKK